MTERRRRRVVVERDGQSAGGERPPRARTGSPAGTLAPPPAGRRPDPATVADEAPLWSGAELDPATAERGLRGLVGGGSSQVSPAAAMRARDAARPTPDDLARAEEELRIVRRNWSPPQDPTPRSGSRQSGGS